MREDERLKKMLLECGVKSEWVELLAPVIEHTAMMKERLDAAMEELVSQDIVIEYDNGGGQSGIRENPLYKGYEALWKSYMTGMCKILECVPRQVVEKEAETIETPRTVLEIVRGRKTKQA
jgi:hypothetical protein